MPTPGKEENECEETSSKRIKLDKADSVRANLSKILEREIRNEINIRRNDLDIIEQRIYQTRQSLVKIRQGVVAEYYKVNSKGILQMPPHPAVKDTFHGKCPAKKSNIEDENIKEENPNIVIDSAEDRTETNDVVNSAIIDGCESKDQQLKKLPRYIPPKYRDKDVVQLFEPRGNVKKQKFRLSIVNVSKWIFNKEDGGATHKWTIYVKNSDPSTDISLFVAKVTFFLHHSYKPNDVISVEYAPFKLTRRGWGEFPLRIQLHFKNDLDKPVDVIHQLKLDTTHSGLDTFGNETVVDVWAHINEKDFEDSNETTTETSRIKQEEQDEEVDDKKESLKSPKTEAESSACISDEYLSTSSLSQLSLQSLTTEISTDFLTDLFKENEPKQKKEQIEKLKAELENECTNRQKEIIKTENFENTDYSEFIDDITSELIFNEITHPEQTSSVTTNNSTDCSTSELIFNKIPVEENNSIVQTLPNPSHINTNTTPEDFQLEIFNSPQILTETKEITNKNTEQTSNFINHNITSSSSCSTIITADTYNPIECLNFVNNEVIIDSEHEENISLTKINENSTNVNNLTCKNYLENFVDTEILSNNEDETVASNHNYTIEIPNILDTTQNQVRIAPNFITANNEGSIGKQAQISVNIYDNLNKIKSKSNAKKVFIEDVNKIKNMKISPIKTNNLNQIKFNRKLSKNDNLLENRNDAIILVKNNELNKNNSVKLVNNLSATNSYTMPTISSQVTIADLNRFATSDSLKQKLFIEMPDGKLREICSVKPANETTLSTVKSKPIVIESSAVKKRKISQLEIPIKAKEVNVMKKTVLINNAGVKLLPSSIIAQTTGNNQIQTSSKRFILPMKTVQKSKQSILKPNTVIASASNQIKLVKSTINHINNAQFVKVMTKENLINENIIIQRKVLPGESLLKKGNQVQGQEIVTVSQSSHQTQAGNTTVQLPLVSTSSVEMRNEILIDRCPVERIEFAISWLIKHYPLVNENAVNDYYKTQHPYCAIDRVTFLRWPLAKQRASEWMRAKKIGKLLLKVCPSLEQWSTFQIIDWARLRGYTPLAIPLRCKYVNNVNIDSSFKFTAPDLNSILIKSEKFSAEEINIDVETELENDSKAKSISMSEERLYVSIDDKYKQLGDYIYKSCDKFGYHFYEEEIDAGVIYPAAERALISVFYSIFDDLFRRSLNASCMRTGIMPAMEVSLEDVKVAILSREEFDIFTNEGLG